MVRCDISYTPPDPDEDNHTDIRCDINIQLPTIPRPRHFCGYGPTEQAALDDAIFSIIVLAPGLLSAINQTIQVLEQAGI